jgi:hypothetical protein
VDPVTLIVTALAAGAALGLKGAASAAIEDAYAALKSLVRRRLIGRPDGELVVTRHEQAPETWAAPLVAELSAAGAGNDAGLVAAAQALMKLADVEGFQSGKYVVGVQGSQGVQVGDHNVQANVFKSSPANDS